MAPLNTPLNRPQPPKYTTSRKKMVIIPSDQQIKSFSPTNNYGKTFKIVTTWGIFLLLKVDLSKSNVIDLSKEAEQSFLLSIII